MHEDRHSCFFFLIAKHNVLHSTCQLPCEVPPVNSERTGTHSQESRANRSVFFSGGFRILSENLVSAQPATTSFTGSAPVHVFFFLDYMLAFWKQMRSVTQRRWHQLWFSASSGAAVAVGLKGGSAILTDSLLEDILGERRKKKKAKHVLLCEHGL